MKDSQELKDLRAAARLSKLLPLTPKQIKEALENASATIDFVLKRWEEEDIKAQQAYEKYLDEHPELIPDLKTIFDKISQERKKHE